VPLYESSLAVVKSEIATFFQVFPEGTVWSNEPLGSDLVLLGQAAWSPIDVDGIEERLNQSAPVAASLRDVGFSSAVDLLATYAGRAADMQPWLAGAEINRDRNLRLQYLAGLRLRSNDAEAIYSSMIAWRKYPDNLFLASKGSRQALEHALE
jgi:spermidine synthase